ncbi:MAG: DUF928 domain-containing protein [Leptolyngbyaceae cyanobacterium]
MKLINPLTSLGSTYIFSKQFVRCAVLAILLGVVCYSPGIAQAADEDQVRQGLPGRRVSGASRLPSSACAVEPLVAIVPETNLGATADPKPTLWLSMPDVSAAKQLEFYLFNAQDEIIYQTSFTVGPAADLVGLDFSNMADAPTLEIDQRYRWAASIVCNPNNRSENISVEGWIDRVDASILGSSGLWYDRLGVLLEQLQQQPQDQAVLSQWHTLMASARLDQIVPLSIDTDSVEITAPTAATTD